MTVASDPPSNLNSSNLFSQIMSQMPLKPSADNVLEITGGQGFDNSIKTFFEKQLQQLTHLNTIGSNNHGNNAQCTLFHGGMPSNFSSTNHTTITVTVQSPIIFTSGKFKLTSFV